MASNFQPMSMPSACAFRMTAACAIGSTIADPEDSAELGPSADLIRPRSAPVRLYFFPKRNPAGMSIDNFWILEAKSRTKNE
jgi:hypothetical protein